MIATITLRPRQALADADRQRIMRWFEQRLDRPFQVAIQPERFGGYVRIAGLPARLARKLEAQCQSYYRDLLNA